MKKLALVLALLFSISTWFSVASLLCGAAGNNPTAALMLPVSLTSIGDEAFEGTAAEEVILSDSLTVIGERAFADSRQLKTVNIPESVEYIAEHAFEGNAGLTIRGARDSYAARWAQEHDIAFLQAESILVLLEKLSELFNGSFFISLVPTFVCPSMSLRRRRKTEDAWRSMRPQDRPELYPIDFRFP